MFKTKILPIVTVLLTVAVAAAFVSFRTSQSIGIRNPFISNQTTIDQDSAEIDNLSLQIVEDSDLNLDEIYPEDTVSQIELAENDLSGLQNDIDSLGEVTLNIDDL